MRSRQAGPVADEPLTRTTARQALTSLAVGSGVGCVAGALIGGVGGRLAMLLLRVTSDSSVIGLRTDDDFRIGEFTSDTIFLVLLTAIAGAMLGAAYVAVRRWLPRDHRPVVAAVVVGADRWRRDRRPGGRRLHAARPAVAGGGPVRRAPGRVRRGAGVGRGTPDRVGVRPAAARARAGGRRWRPSPCSSRRRRSVVVGAIGWAALRRWPAAGRIWWSAPVTAAGRAVGVGVTAWATVVLIQDAAEIL